MIAMALLVALLALGDLTLRALVGAAPPAAARAGFALVLGLVGLPLVALVLYGCSIAITGRSLAAGLTLLTLVMGGVALARGWSLPRRTRTLAAFVVPGLIAAVVMGTAVGAYVRLPHPAAPGYTSMALGGWAQNIDRPIIIPAGGVAVPIRVSSAGSPATVEAMRVLVGGRPVAPDRPVTIAADTTSAVTVRVPAPPDGCLYRIEISLGTASTVFYGRGASAC